jgi:hypothetical protein
MNYLIPIREFIVKNFIITLKSVEISNYRLYNSYFLYLFKIIPFFVIKFLFSLLKIKYICLIDDIYFSNYGGFRISPSLMNVSVFNDDTDQKCNIINIILKYNGTVPIWYIIQNENLNRFRKIQFKYFSKGKMENKILNLHEINNKLLYEIF